MTYPNPKFEGMSQVTPKAVSAAINDYHSNKSRRGVKRRLDLLKKVSTLAELVDFCIETYRAWGDAVLLKAGNFLGIGKFGNEIAAAKEYVKKEIITYLSNKPHATETDYDEWHKNICTTLADNRRHFSAYSAHRKASTAGSKNKIGFTMGNGQKFLNMLMKDLYACFAQTPQLATRLPNYKEYFKYCHMPLDSYILRFIDDIQYRKGADILIRSYTWSTLNNYDVYMGEQCEIRKFVNSAPSPCPTVLETEFVVWPLYK